MQKLEIFKIGVPSDKVFIPCVDDLSAGFPSPSADYTGDVIDLNDILITSPGNTYFARVTGYYLLEDELEKGDAILFDASLHPRKGDLAVCVIDGEVQLKYVDKRQGETYFVQGATPQAVAHNADNDSRIWGVVTAVIKVRRYKGRRQQAAVGIKQRGLKESPKRAIRWGYAGQDADDPMQTVNLTEELVRNPIYTVFGRVNGVSLTEDGIDDADTVIIDRIADPVEGDLIVSFNDTGFILKYAVVKEDGIWLLPGNKKYPPIRVDDDNGHLVWGIVVSSIKLLRRKERMG